MFNRGYIWLADWLVGSFIYTHREIGAKHYTDRKHVKYAGYCRLLAADVNVAAVRPSIHLAVRPLTVCLSFRCLVYPFVGFFQMK